MIYDRLDKVSLYGGAGSALAKALEYASKVEADLADGRHEIDGDDVYGVVAGYDSSADESRPFEAHREYIDVQVVLSGEERLEIAPVEQLETTKPYDAASDVEFFQPVGESSSLIMRPGIFAVLYPHEGHRPGCQLEKIQPIRKLVVKVRV